MNENININTNNNQDDEPEDNKSSNSWLTSAICGLIVFMILTLIGC